MSDDIKENILSPAAWLRILFMVMFAFFCWVMGIIIVCLIVIQAIFNLITGKSNENIASACNISVEYLYQILRFLTYCSDEKPFPFAPLPAAREESAQDVESEVIDNFYADEADEILEEEEPSVSDEPSASNEPSTSNEPAGMKEQELAREEALDDVFADISFTDSDEGDDSEDKKKPEGSE